MIAKVLVRDRIASLLFLLEDTVRENEGPAHESYAHTIGSARMHAQVTRLLEEPLNKVVFEPDTKDRALMGSANGFPRHIP